MFRLVVTEPCPIPVCSKANFAGGVGIEVQAVCRRPIRFEKMLLPFHDLENRCHQRMSWRASSSIMNVNLVFQLVDGVSSVKQSAKKYSPSRNDLADEGKFAD